MLDLNTYLNFLSYIYMEMCVCVCVCVRGGGGEEGVCVKNPSMEDNEQQLFNLPIPGYRPGQPLTHWGRVTHICVSDLTIIGSDNSLSPGRRQAIICTNAGILLIEPLWTNFSETVIDFHTFSFQKLHFKISSGKWRTFSSASIC